MEKEVNKTEEKEEIKHSAIKSVQYKAQKAIDAFLVHGDKLKAMREAGYSKYQSEDPARHKQQVENAAHFFNKPHIRAYIEERKQAAAKIVETKIACSMEWVLSNAQEIVERCLQHIPVIVEGKPTGEFTFDASNATKALDLICKVKGLGNYSKEAAKELAKKKPTTNLSFPVSLKPGEPFLRDDETIYGEAIPLHKPGNGNGSGNGNGNGHGSLQ